MQSPDLGPDKFWKALMILAIAGAFAAFGVMCYGIFWLCKHIVFM